VEFVPPFAPFVVLGFLALGGILGATGLALVAAAILRKTQLLPWIAGFGVVVVLGYAGVLLADSLVSRERVLGLGERKYFCEIDCHLAYSVEEVETTQVLGPPLRPLRAKGRWLVVRLKTWFDENTISRHRGDAPLYPNPRLIYLRADDGRRFAPSPQAEQALAASGRTSIPLTRPLRPGETYETLLAFDLPPEARDPRLYVGSDDPVSFLLIGHEQSPLHRKVWFRI
jgi:hypothetical protein